MLNVGMGLFDLHGLLLCVTEGFLSKLLCNHNVNIVIFGLHGRILYESQDYFSELICVHNVGIETFDLHGLILCVSEGLSLLLGSHILNIYVF